MRYALAAATLAAAFAATTASAAGDERATPAPAAAHDPGWEFALTAYPTDPRGGERYTSAVATADRGPLHFEARYNYESIGARSAFVGWSFAGGEDFTWELRPLLGGAWGTTQAFVPGLEASFAWRQLDVYVEAEYVRDNRAHDDSYVYAWSELGWRPAEWLRVGLAGQRTRQYGGDREFQRGPFVQFTWSRLTVGGYWFNPGAGEQVFVGSIGIAF
ncbi:MAG: hypothetical protein U1F48_00335 [Burkholderiales bacterium]